MLTIFKKYPFQTLVSFTMFFWLGMLITGTIIHDGAERVSVFAADIEFVYHFFTIILLIYIIHRYSNKNNNQLFYWLLIISLVLASVDIMYYIAAYANQTYLQNMHLIYFLLYYFPCIIYCFIMITFLVKVLLKNVVSNKFFFKLIVALAIFNILTLGLYFSSIHYAYKVLNWQTIAQLAMLSIELIMFDFAILGLIYSISNSARLLLIGTVALIMGDFFLTYSSLTQTVKLYQYGELFWLLGLMFIFYSIFHMLLKKDFSIENWFGKYNTIRSKVVFVTFSLSITGFLIFFLLSDIFSIVDKEIFTSLPVYILLFSVIFIIFSILLGTSFEAPFIKLISLTENLKNDIYDEKYIFNIEEFKYLQDTIIKAFKYKTDIDNIKSRFGQLVAEVAHDLKSPVTALNLTLKKIENNNKVDESILKDLFLATKDITNISSSILSDYYQITDIESENKFIFKDDGNYPRFVVLPNLIESLITRKQTEFGDGINIKLKCDKWFYTNLCQISPTKLIRNLSNLINNSFQSCKNSKCIITVDINKKSNALEIIISDNGSGIPVDKLNVILSAGDSSKHKGQGLGIVSCRKYLDEIKGTFKINSAENIGTKVTLELPLISNPNWFIQEVLFEKDQKFVVIDDDSQMILHWQDIFSKLGVRAFYFLNSASFLDWFGGFINEPIIVFSDYDLKESINGYDLLNGLFKFEKSQFILITNHAEEEWLQKIIEKQDKINLLPKGLLDTTLLKRV